MEQSVKKRLPRLEIETAKLGNGLVLSGDESRNADSIAIMGSVRAGAIYGEPSKFGTAELIARLLTRGSKLGGTAASIARRIEELGATLQFSNNDERVRFTARCHYSDIDLLLDIISECLANPSFPEDQIGVAKAELVSDLDAEKDETRTLVFRKLMSMIYEEGKPYGRNSLGSQSDVARISRSDIISFYEKYYRPSSTLIVA